MSIEQEILKMNKQIWKDSNRNYRSNKYNTSKEKHKE